jgi:hypothetical protein
MLGGGCNHEAHLLIACRVHPIHNLTLLQRNLRNHELKRQPTERTNERGGGIDQLKDNLPNECVGIDQLKDNLPNECGGIDQLKDNLPNECRGIDQLKDNLPNTKESTS